jgi:predicted anti-sigma-YlaC factor YlaD
MTTPTSAPLTSPHLTDDQFTECLIDNAPSGAAEAHLAACPQCRAELSRFLVSVDDFSSAALAWSYAQPAVSPRAIAAAARPAFLTPARWAIAAALLIVLGVPLVRHHNDDAVSTAAATAEDTEAQIAQDNRLLQSVNVAIAVDDSAPLRQYQLTRITRSRIAPRSPSARDSSRLQ